MVLRGGVQKTFFHQQTLCLIKNGPGPDKSKKNGKIPLIGTFKGPLKEPPVEPPVQFWVAMEWMVVAMSP